MASNQTVSPNTTHLWWSNSTEPSIPELHVLPRTFVIFVYTFIVFELAFIIAGLVLNLYFFVAIIKSAQLRSLFRNKILCNLLALHAIDCAMCLPMDVSYGFMLLNMKFGYLGCSFALLYVTVQLISEFVTTWMIVILLVLFIVNILDFSPERVFTPPVVKFGAAAALLAPYLAAVLLVVPVLYHDWSQYSCLGFFHGFKDTLTIFIMALPMCLSCLLVSVAVPLRYRIFARLRGSDAAMHNELIQRHRLVDKSLPYVVLVVGLVVCEVIRLSSILNPNMFYQLPTEVHLGLHGLFFLLSDSRVVLMPLVTLLLPDVRERIKTWRPWYRPGHGIDLTMAYQKDAA